MSNDGLLNALSVLAANQTDARKLQEDPFSGMPALGKLLGSGKHRLVYEHGSDPGLVVKILKPEWRHVNSNAAEWRNWKVVSATDNEKYFAPCVSKGTAWLVMVRCSSVPQGVNTAMFPKACLIDPSKKNFGMIGERIVCIDYGNILPSDVANVSAMVQLRFR